MKETAMPLSSEERQAVWRYRDGIVRGIETRVQIDSIRAARAKLRVVSARLEGGAKPADVLHDLWRAMSFLDDSFNTATMRLIRSESRCDE